MKDNIKYIKAFMKYIWRDKSFFIGLIMLTVFMMLAFVVSFLSPYDPRRWNTAPRERPPSWEYPLGTTTLGQNLFWLLTWALRNSLIIGFSGSLIGLIIGSILGFIAGHKGGIIDRIISNIADIFIAIPILMLIILIGSLIKTQLNITTLGVLFGVLTWSMPVRNVRSMILSLREQEFTYTDIFSGLNLLEIVYRHYLPFVIPWISMAAINRIFWAIGTEVTLAIFGLSAIDEATLGTMLYWALKYQALLRGLYWWVLTPTITLVLLFLSLYLISVGLNTYLNPKARLQRMIGGK
ncbi:MAG: ABC transporter permease [Candidatus Methanomethylicia archaeon]